MYTTAGVGTYVADNPKLNDAENRDFRVFDGCQQRPDRLYGRALRQLYFGCSDAHGALPGAARIGALQELHLGQQVAEVLGVDTGFAMPGKNRVMRPNERRLGEYRIDAGRPGGF